MSLTPEWRGRIEHWQNTLKTLFYVPVADVPLGGRLTLTQLTPDEAVRGRFSPMPPGCSWGAKWEYAWFKSTVKLPRQMAGKEAVLRVDTGGESRVLIDGVERGGRDHFHEYFPLADKAVAGRTFDLLIESYAGHGATPCGGGPAPHGVPTVPEPPAQQRVVGQTTVGIWQEDCYQLWLDVQTLLEVRDRVDANSLRVAEIDAGLRDCSLIVDLELPGEEMLTTVRAGRKRLAPLLASRNGSTSPLMYCFGHSHIDVAWLWPLQETERKCARTFATQLELMERYPEYKFLQSQAHLYRMTQRLYPELYARIKAAAKRGQFIPEGGMWVEADTNISGGESLIRQFLHGKRFFRDEFGVECELMWLPDVFGYSGAMPQIMTGCGIKYFSTQKIFWTYNGGEPFPHNTFWWEGIDGTRILSHIHNDYNSQTTPAAVMQRWNERVQKDGISTRLMPFGWGDGGGGPTRDHLEYLRRLQNLEGVPRTKLASPIQYFHDEEKKKAVLPVYVGELYFQAHRGTYTTQARTKRGNRKSEFLLREAELWSAVAGVLSGFSVPAAALDEAWKGVLLNQFHDIIPGSSIHRVYEEAEALYAQVLTTAHETAMAAAAALVKPARKTVTVFNSLGWERSELVALPQGFRGAAVAGKALPVQKIGDTLYTEVSLPSCGWVTVTDALAAKAAGGVKAAANLLENEFLTIRFNAFGEIVSCMDKETGSELAAAPMNRFRMYKDVPRWFDAWDIDSTYEFLPVELTAKAEIEVVSAGGLAGVLRIRRPLHDSVLTQEIRLRRGSRRVEFFTRVDWHEKHKLLKVSFPTAVHANEAIHEIQFGHLRRPNHSSRPFDADRFEVSNHKWTALAEENRGAAVLNDCKYGVDVDGGSINLTLLRASQAPDMLADQGMQEFTYAFTAWNGSFFACDVVRAGYELNSAVLTAPGAGGVRSLFAVDAANVVIETVKPAEDGSGDIVVRLYEAKHSATACRLTTSLPVRRALVTDMLEQGATPVKVSGSCIALRFRPFEIKTLRLCGAS